MNGNWHHGCCVYPSQLPKEGESSGDLIEKEKASVSQRLRSAMFARKCQPFYALDKSEVIEALGLV